ncbi:MAG: pilus assembly PilX family protein [Burkholderiaceae bacterium]
MTMPIQTVRRPASLPHSRFLQSQRGAVLMIAMVLLVVISLLAVTSIRNAASTASVVGNVRTTELATQAAEIALLHCESSVLKVLDSTSTYATTFNSSKILAASTPPQWQDMTIWDSTSTKVFVLLLDLVNEAMSDATYQRPPECMVEHMDSDPTYYVVTARGFGPEVEQADANRSRPVGSEVWLQSNIKVEQ